VKSYNLDVAVLNRNRLSTVPSDHSDGFAIESSAFRWCARHRSQSVVFRTQQLSIPRRKDRQRFCQSAKPNRPLTFWLTLSDRP